MIENKPMDFTVPTFDTKTERHNTYSVKWERDIPKDVLPLWVADTDFISPKPVLEALHKAVSHGIFGYSFFTEDIKNVIQQWLSSRHGYDIQKEWLLFQSGVVPSLATIILALTKEQDGILIQPPIYPPFMNLVKANHRTLHFNQLHYEDGRYTIDFDDFEQQLKKGIKLFILCSPHNPVGRVWTKEELTKMIVLCKQYKTIIISDEIHHDLVLFDNQHTPTATIDYSDSIITLFAPSKTFNVAGLKAAVIVCENADIRTKISQTLQSQGTTEVNKMGIVALKAAYEHGEPWLEEQLQYIENNIAFTKSFLDANLPHVHLVEPEGTYLLWLDVSYYCDKIANVKTYLEQQGRVLVEDGQRFGPGGKSFIRLNVGTQQERLKDGLTRIANALLQL